MLKPASKQNLLAGKGKKITLVFLDGSTDKPDYT